jgi:hypothetical protein
VTAAAFFRKLRREETVRPEKSISVSLGKCIQPMRSHMMASWGGSDCRGLRVRAGRYLGSDDSIVGTPTEENR